MEASYEFEKYGLHYVESHSRVVPSKEAPLYDGYYEPLVANTLTDKRSKRSLWTRRVGGRIGDDIVAPEEKDLNELDVKDPQASPKIDAYGMMLSDDEIEDSD
jgi:hypothetical protein